MLISDDVVFLHVPKTGGRSISEYLVNNLRGPMALSLGYKAATTAVRPYAFDDVASRVEIFRGRRHEDMAEAAAILHERGRELPEVPLVVAMIRNPYDLEVSHFEHLRKASVVARRGPESPPVRAAATGDFGHFVRHAPFFGCLPAEMERYYQHDGQVPPNLRIVRFETMATDLPEAIAPFSLDRWPIPHVNASEGRRPYLDYLTPEIEQAIYDKYRYLFDFYPRVDLGDLSG